MELSERCIQTLEKENWHHIYEWQDKPGIIYPEHTHRGKVTIFITEGSIELTISGEVLSLRPGDRFNVPPNTPHSAVVGPQGVQFVVGEEIEGDS